MNLNTSPYQLPLVVAAAYIVLGNLIRNAIQHTWEGEVWIKQQGAAVEIINQNAEHSTQDDLGFGVGLELTERLCRRLHWNYQSTLIEGGRHVTLRFPEHSME